MTTNATLNGTSLAAAVPAAAILAVRRQLVGRRRHTTIDIPGRAGAFRFDEEPGDRNLELLVDIEADTFAARRAAVLALAAWADIGTTARLIIDDEPDRYHDALLNETADTNEWLRTAAIPLNFMVGPYAFAISTTSQPITATSNPDSDTFTLTDAIYAEPVVELLAIGGTMETVTLTTNGDALAWSPGDGIARAAGETLTISSISDTVTLGANDDVNLTGTFDEADLDMADVSGAFPILLPGANAWSIEWTGTATAIGITYLWRERFR